MVVTLGALAWALAGSIGMRQHQRTASGQEQNAGLPRWRPPRWRHALRQRVDLQNQYSVPLRGRRCVGERWS